LKLNTDRHEASRGLFATAELLMNIDSVISVESLDVMTHETYMGSCR